MHNALRALLIAALLLATLAPSAQLQAAPAATPGAPLPDPTRPPVALQMATAAQQMAQRLNPPEATEPAVPKAMPVLQGVQIGAHGVASAMLDGQLLLLGDKLGELKVVAIDRQGVTLRGGQGQQQRLTLLSSDTKQPVGSLGLTRSASLAPTLHKTLRPGDASTAPPPGPPVRTGQTAGASPSPRAEQAPGQPPSQPGPPHSSPAVLSTTAPAAPAASAAAPPSSALSSVPATPAATALSVADQTRP